MDEFDGSSEEKLEECIEKYVTEIINAKVEIDLDEEMTMTLPRVFETYKTDFGNSEENIITFVFKYLDSEHEL